MTIKWIHKNSQSERRQKRRKEQRTDGKNRKQIAR